MKPLLVVMVTLAAACGVSAASTRAPAPAERAPLSEEDAWIARVWRSPVFLRELLGTYGARSDIEPKISDEDRELLNRALLLLGRPGGRDPARRMLEQVAGPQRSAALDFTLGNIHLQSGALDRAILWYRRAIAKFPSFLRAQKNLGLALVRQNAFEEAIEPLTRTIALGGGDGLTYGLLGFAYAQTERWASAETAYRQAIMLQPQVVDWQLGLARAVFRLRKFEEAAALCEELIRREPDRAEYWLLLANAWLGLKQPLKAAEVYEWLRLHGAATADHLFTLGDIYVNERYPDLAAEVYLEAYARAPEGTEIRLLKAAEALAQRDGAAEAIRLLEALQANGFERLQAAEKSRYYKLEARLAAARGAAADVQIRWLEQAAEQDPLDGDVFLLLGRKYAEQGDVERAMLQYERAAALESHAAEALLRQAQLLVRQRQFAEAIPLLKRSLDLRPRDDVARYLENVERLARPR